MSTSRGEGRPAVHRLRAFLRLAVAALVIGMVALAVAAVVVPRVIGAVPLTVLSGSMEPTLSAGDLVVVQEVEDPATIAIGDVITYQPDPDSETLVTHRVVGLVLGIEGTSGFITQGDANNVTDEPIVLDQVMGRVLYALPLVGYLSGTELGSIALTVAALGLVVFGFVQIFTPSRRSRARADAGPVPEPGSTSEAGQSADLATTASTATTATATTATTATRKRKGAHHA